MAKTYESGFREALQAVIASCTPWVKDCAAAIKAENAKEAPSLVNRAYLRGQLHSFGKIVGEMKSKLEEPPAHAIPSDSDPSLKRVMLGIEYQEALEAAGRLRYELVRAEDPAAQSALGEKLRLAEQAADDLIRKYALD